MFFDKKEAAEKLQKVFECVAAAVYGAAGENPALGAFTAEYATVRLSTAQNKPRDITGV